MLLLNTAVCLQIYQSLHQFYYNNEDITMHYTQIKVAPLSSIQITPTSLLINNQMKIVDALTANKLGEIYLRYPILHDDDVHVHGINITYKNITTKIHLDEQSQYELSTMECDSKSLHGKLKQVALFTHAYKTNAVQPPSSEVPDIPKSKYFSDTTLSTIIGLWNWIKEQFRKAFQTIRDVIFKIRAAFDFTKLKTNRIIMWHYVQLIFKYSLKSIDAAKWSNVLPKVDFETPPTSKIPKQKDLPNTKNILFGSLVESMQDVQSQSPSELTHNYTISANLLKTIVLHPNVTQMLNSSDLELLKDINTAHPSTQVTDILLTIISKIWGAIQFATTTLFNVVTQLLKPFMKVFAYIQYGITTFPLIIPGITTWIARQFNDQLRLIDFFLLPLSAKINLMFNKNNIQFTPSDQAAILGAKTFEALQFMDENVKLKLAWADSLATSFGFSYTIPFLALRAIPVVNWLNPLWNSASFVLVIFSAPHNIFAPNINLPEIRIHCARLFSSFLGSLPNPFIFYPNAVAIVLQLAVYKIPFTVSRVTRMLNRSIDSLPKTYKMKKFMLGMHTAVDSLRIASTFVSVIPGGQPANFAILAMTTALKDVIIDYAIQWKSRMAF